MDTKEETRARVVAILSDYLCDARDCRDAPYDALKKAEWALDSIEANGLVVVEREKHEQLERRAVAAEMTIESICRR